MPQPTDPRPPPPVGRLAPSPTGRLHLGIARTLLVAYLRARQRGGRLIMRVEDLDPPRTVAGADTAIAEDLRWLGIEWDEGPALGGAPGPYHQSARAAHYEAALDELRGKGLLFDCSCTRRQLAAASSAPHGDLGPRYPGTCHAGVAHPGRPISLRFRMPAADYGFTDGLLGPVDDPGLQTPDDFIVRRADGLYAYQLAVVVDDIAMGVTEVVRGADLVSSTPRQLALYRALGAEPPAFVHVPLLLGPDGKRLSKRHGSTAIADYRAAGHPPDAVLGLLWASLGLCPPGASRSIAALQDDFELAALPREATTLTAELLASLRL